MREEYDDLTVTIHLSHKQASILRDFIEGVIIQQNDPVNPDPHSILASVRLGIAKAEKERADRDARAPRF